MREMNIFRQRPECWISAAETADGALTDRPSTLMNSVEGAPTLKSPVMVPQVPCDLEENALLASLSLQPTEEGLSPSSGMLPRFGVKTAKGFEKASQEPTTSAHLSRGPLETAPLPSPSAFHSPGVVQLPPLSSFPADSSSGNAGPMTLQRSEFVCARRSLCRTPARGRPFPKPAVALPSALISLRTGGTNDGELRRKERKALSDEGTYTAACCFRGSSASSSARKPKLFAREVTSKHAWREAAVIQSMREKALLRRRAGSSPVVPIDLSSDEESAGTIASKTPSAENALSVSKGVSEEVAILLSLEDGNGAIETTDDTPPSSSSTSRVRDEAAESASLQGFLVHAAAFVSSQGAVSFNSDPLQVLKTSAAKSSSQSSREEEPTCCLSPRRLKASSVSSEVGHFEERLSFDCEDAVGTGEHRQLVLNILAAGEGGEEGESSISSSVSLELWNVPALASANGVSLSTSSTESSPQKRNCALNLARGASGGLCTLAQFSAKDLRQIQCCLLRLKEAALAAASEHSPSVSLQCARATVSTPHTGRIEEELAETLENKHFQRGSFSSPPTIPSEGGAGRQAASGAVYPHSIVQEINSCNAEDGAAAAVRNDAASSGSLQEKESLKGRRDPETMEKTCSSQGLVEGGGDSDKCSTPTEQKPRLASRGRQPALRIYGVDELKAKEAAALQRLSERSIDASLSPARRKAIREELLASAPGKLEKTDQDDCERAKEEGLVGLLSGKRPRDASPTSEEEGVESRGELSSQTLLTKGPSSSNSEEVQNIALQDQHRCNGDERSAGPSDVNVSLDDAPQEKRKKVEAISSVASASHSEEGKIQNSLSSEGPGGSAEAGILPVCDFKNHLQSLEKSSLEETSFSELAVEAGDGVLQGAPLSRGDSTETGGISLKPVIPRLSCEAKQVASLYAEEPEAGLVPSGLDSSVFLLCIKVELNADVVWPVPARKSRRGKAGDVCRSPETSTLSSSAGQEVFFNDVMQKCRPEEEFPSDNADAFSALVSSESLRSGAPSDIPALTKGEGSTAGSASLLESSKSIVKKFEGLLATDSGEKPFAQEVSQCPTEGDSEAVASVPCAIDKDCKSTGSFSASFSGVLRVDFRKEEKVCMSSSPSSPPSADTEQALSENAAGCKTGWLILHVGPSLSEPRSSPSAAKIARNEDEDPVKVGLQRESLEARSLCDASKRPVTFSFRENETQNKADTETTATPAASQSSAILWADGKFLSERESRQVSSGRQSGAVDEILNSERQFALHACAALRSVCFDTSNPSLSGSRKKGTTETSSEADSDGFSLMKAEKEQPPALEEKIEECDCLGLLEILQRAGGPQVRETNADDEDIEEGFNMTKEKTMPTREPRQGLSARWLLLFAESTCGVWKRALLSASFEMESAVKALRSAWKSQRVLSRLAVAGRYTERVPSQVTRFRSPAFDGALSDSSLRRLNAHEFLDDSIIDFFLQFIVEHILTPEQRRQVYVSNTFFMSSLLKEKSDAEAHRRLTRWLRKEPIPLPERNLILIPIHHKHQHWSLAVVVCPWRAVRSSSQRAASPAMSASRDFFLQNRTLQSPVSAKRSFSEFKALPSAAVQQRKRRMNCDLSPVFSPPLATSPQIPLPARRPKVRRQRPTAPHAVAPIEQRAALFHVDSMGLRNVFDRNRGRLKQFIKREFESRCRGGKYSSDCDLCTEPCCWSDAVSCSLHTPRQQNGYDCGVFVIEYALFLVRNLDLAEALLHGPKPYSSETEPSLQHSLWSGSSADDCHGSNASRRRDLQSREKWGGQIGASAKQRVPFGFWCSCMAVGRTSSEMPRESPPYGEWQTPREEKEAEELDFLSFEAAKTSSSGGLSQNSECPSAALSHRGSSVVIGKFSQEVPALERTWDEGTRAPLASTSDCRENGGESCGRRHSHLSEYESPLQGASAPSLSDGRPEKLRRRRIAHAKWFTQVAVTRRRRQMLTMLEFMRSNPKWREDPKQIKFLKSLLLDSPSPSELISLS